MTDTNTYAALTARYLANASVIVVKVGSALLVDDDGKLRDAWIAALADDIAALTKKGMRVVVVSSGAIALGKSKVHIAGGKKSLARLEEKQAAAAIGQIALAGAWQRAFATHDIATAQILLSPDDTETRRRHLNARATLQTLLGAGAIPVVNENDTVATEEIRYGDNDRLAARVAQMVSADALILLSDIDGLYDSDPRNNANAKHIAEIAAIDSRIENMAGPAGREYASGGMVTKITAARIAGDAGCSMVICDGAADNPIAKLMAGARCSWFRAASNPGRARKKWIAGGLAPSGSIVIDDGAAAALAKGKSLLAAGVVRAEGNFERGDIVAIGAATGAAIGRGISHYNADEVRRIAGCKSDAIAGILGYEGRGAVIHADNLALTRQRRLGEKE